MVKHNSTENLALGIQVANDTKSLAMRAVKQLPPSSTTARNIARQRIVCPVDYVRYAEFESILRDFEPAAGMSILDVGSPQWFSIYLANKYPTVKFHYMNIIDSELNPFMEIATALGIGNLVYIKDDVRNMNFSPNTFDKILSVSVIEHIYPEDGGDLKALGEIYRVLKPRGEFLLSVPYKSTGNIVYVDGEVYERGKKEKNFFAREYDEKMFQRLIEKSDFTLSGIWYNCERVGLFSVDYYEWGPGKNSFFMKYLVKSRKLLERIFFMSLDELLAQKYLNVSREILGRLINASAKLIKT